jgi:thioredoxin 1
MSENITNVVEASFDAEVLHSKVPVLIDFWAPWCGPCLALMPTIEAIASMYGGRLKVIKINCDDAKLLADQFGVRGIPHLVFMNGDEPAKVVNSRTKTRLCIELDGMLDAEDAA